MKHLMMQFSVTYCHVISLRSKYSPQHPVLKHPQSTEQGVGAARGVSTRPCTAREAKKVKTGRPHGNKFARDRAPQDWLSRMLTVWGADDLISDSVRPVWKEVNWDP
jgi:hypothetical protein